MDLFPEYIIKFSLVLAAHYALYVLFLRKLTFYHWIRYYFIGAILVSVSLPFLNIGFLFSNSANNPNEILGSIPVVNDIPFIKSEPRRHFEIAGVVGIALVTGSLALGCRLVIQFLSLLGLKSRSSLVRRETGILFYEAAEDISSFSFGNMVFINRRISSASEYEHIIAHERVHVQQWHTADMLLMELVCVFNWYNPFVWMMRKTLRQNLEFIADDAVLQSGFSTKEYQYSVLRSASAGVSPLANSFSMPNIKKRIVMMNTIKSSKMQLLRFTFILPVLLLVCVLFRQNDAMAQNSDSAIRLTSESGVVIKGEFKDGIPLFIVDGMIQPSTFDLKLLKPTDIKAMTVWKGDSAIAKFGQKAIHGAIEIETSVPLLVIDGKVQPKVSIIDNLVRPDDVERMNVIKDDAAVAKYGQSARNGVIEIITKKK